ncbi:MAG: SDR family NAD(P)-dependent oxidoreductase [Candidatus Limnocylindrales bacterium]
MDIQHLIDDALEIAVIPSFSRIGYAVRRRLYGWRPLPSDALAGQTVLVTGPTSGLGRTMADELAGLGARLILVGRDQQKLVAVRDALVARHGEDRFRTVVADMASLTSVRTAVTTIVETEPRLDVVIDNAGAIFPTRSESPDGIESTFATMVAGPFVLVAGLLPLLRRTGGARVIAVTSGGQYAQRLHLDDLQTSRRPFDGTRAYAHAKRAQVALIREWARRIVPADITFNAMHPGWADTPGLAASLPGFSQAMGPMLRSPTEGADTAVWLAADPAAGHETGQLFLDRRARPFDRIPSTRVGRADRRRLWDALVRLTGTSDPAPDKQRIPADRPRQGATT